MEEKDENEIRHRNVTIDRHLLNVIEDAYAVRREKGNLKFIKHEMLPPLTGNFRQHRRIREVDRVHGILKKDIEKCDQADMERQQFLNDVIKKCETLKAVFEKSEGAIFQLQKQKETHMQVVETMTKEIDRSMMEMKRYIRAVGHLTSIRDIMQSVINENTCYFDFLEQVATESKRYISAREITGRYEKLLVVRKQLNEKLDESLVKLEETKRQVLLQNASGNSEQFYVLQKLQAIDYELNLVKSKTIRYEMALNNISIESLEQMRTSNLVLKSAEQMIENLIKEKVIGKKYKNKTLAQQFEVVRKNYIKKKAVLREYQKAKDALKLKKTKRVEIFEDYENTLGRKLMGQKRLDDLSKKKKLIGWKKAEADHLRRLRRLRGTKAGDESDEEFDALQEPGVLVDLHIPQHFSRVARPNSDDDWEDEEEADFDDLARFGSDESSHNSLLVDGEKQEFINERGNSVTLETASSTGSGFSLTPSQSEGLSSFMTFPRRITAEIPKIKS